MTPQEFAESVWASAFNYNTDGFTPLPVEGFKGSTEPFTFDDVEQVLMHADGENDGPEWLVALRLKDGRFVFVEAGCDYTGWD